MLRFLTAGESHGPALTVVVEGLPAGVPVNRAAIDAELRLRQGGHGRGGRMKIETDGVEILGGVRHGRTLGSPVSLLIRNRDHANWADVMSPEPQPPEAARRRALHRPRPGHADLAGALKYQTTDLRNVLERASARETAARVAAGALVRPLLEACGISMRSHVLRIGEAATTGDATPWDALAAAESSPVRCAEAAASDAMVAAIDAARRAGDTLGGVFEVVACGVLPGLGSHAQWDLRLDGCLAQAVMSIPGIKAVALGAGVESADTPGSRFHDEIVLEAGRVERTSNRAGGVEGGLSNGGEIRVRAWMKPIPTLVMPLRSVDLVTGRPESASVERSDTCVVPAAAVVGEAMVGLILARALLDKLGGDTLAELLDHLAATRARVASLLSPGASDDGAG